MPSYHLALTAQALVTATPALAAGEKVYEGTAGPVRIVVAIYDNGRDISGHYFYASTRLDTHLHVERQGATLKLTSDITQDQITLTASGANITGTLVTAKGRSLPVMLHPATLPRTLPADLPPKLSFYEKLQVAGLALVPGPVTTVNGKGLRWYREGVTGLRLFRLESGYTPAAMATINHALAQQQLGPSGHVAKLHGVGWPLRRRHVAGRYAVAGRACGQLHLVGKLELRPCRAPRFRH